MDEQEGAGRPESASHVRGLGADIVERLTDDIGLPVVDSQVRYSNEATLGSFVTEEESAAEFDRRIAVCPLFQKVYSEVCGQYIQPRICCEPKEPRIDRILMPSKVLEVAGWPHGPLGVELKASRLRVASAIEQCLDYSRAIWTIKEGYHIMVEWIFIWPWGGLGGNVGSLAVQNRIGGVWGNAYEPLRFEIGGPIAISWNRDGTIRSRRLAVGAKRGSRGSKKV
jgi:hypothetical protein